MDKLTVYGRPGLLGFSCASFEQCNVVRCKDCAEYVLVDPEALAALEREVETLMSIMVRKDEALRLARPVIAHVVENCPKRDREHVPKCSCRGPCNESEALTSVQHALSLTPEAVKQQAEYARMGRAVVEWQEREAAAPSGLNSKGWREAIRTLGEVIAQAKEDTETDLVTPPKFSCGEPCVKGQPCPDKWGCDPSHEHAG